jgi:hypothetical protein
LAAETFGIDPEDAEGRTDALLTLLALTPSMWMNRPAPVNVQINPNDPFFPSGESQWHQTSESWGTESWANEDWANEDWDSEDWDSEDWDSEDWDSAESDEHYEAWEYEGV